MGEIDSGERQLNTPEFCDYARLLGLEPADSLRSMLKPFR